MLVLLSGASSVITIRLETKRWFHTPSYYASEGIGKTGVFFKSRVRGSTLDSRINNPPRKNMDLRDRNRYHY